MRGHLLILAVVGLSLGGAVAAEPAKAPVRKAEQPTDQPVQVVVAAADQVRTDAPADPAAATPVKRERKARVTTCRCGDQTASND